MGAFCLETGQAYLQCKYIHDSHTREYQHTCTRVHVYLVCVSPSDLLSTSGAWRLDENFKFNFPDDLRCRACEDLSSSVVVCPRGGSSPIAVYRLPLSLITCSSDYPGEECFGPDVRFLIDQQASHASLRAAKVHT